MPILTVILVLIAVGVLLWAINTYGTMIDGRMKQIINFVVIGLVIFWLLKISGILGAVSTVTV